MTIKHIGFVIDNQLPNYANWRKEICTFGNLLFGRSSDSSAMFMRFSWIAQQVNEEKKASGFSYELYRPWRKYNAVVFIRSMSDECNSLATALQKKGIPTVFDIHVDYFSEPWGVFHYEGMKPTKELREQAIRMAQTCDGVFTASQQIEDMAKVYNPQTICLPDNVNFQLPPPLSSLRQSHDKKLTLLWSGAIGKLTDLLSIEKTLRSYSSHIQLLLITDDPTRIESSSSEYGAQVKDLLSCMDHTFFRFSSIKKLMKIYARDGVYISPKFMNNSFNLGHSAWKITLPLVCGRLVLCSPLRSYQQTALWAGDKGVRICYAPEDWAKYFDELLAGDIRLKDETAWGRAVVKKYYSSEVIAKQHMKYMQRIIDAKEKTTIATPKKLPKTKKTPALQESNVPAKKKKIATTSKKKK